MNDTMAEHERLVEYSLHSWLAEDRPVPIDRDILITSVLQQTREAAGTRRRFLGWLDRGAEARRRRHNHDIPYETYPGRNRLMSTATSLVAVLAIVALGANVIVDSGQPPSAGGAATLSVVADGSGDYATIGEAVAAAEDGDTILVGPGRYREALLIDKDITIQGDGPREDVVITAYDDPALWPSAGDRVCDRGTMLHEGCSMLLADADATLSDLTFAGDFAGVYAYGGAPLLERLTFDRVGRPWKHEGPPAGESLVLLDGSRAIVRDSEFDAGRRLYIDDAAVPLIEGNAFTGGSDITAYWAGDEAVIRDNRIVEAGYAILVGGRTRMLIEGNAIEDAQVYGISVGGDAGASEWGGIAPIIRGNTLSGSGRVGIFVERNTEPTIDGNQLTGHPTAIQVGESPATITGNDIRDGQTGIVVISGGTPTITDNTVDVSGRGIVAGTGTSPTISGNDVCGGETSIYVSDDSAAQLGDNRTCEGDTTG